MKLLNQTRLYISVFIITMLLPWVATAFFNSIITVFITGIICMGLYLLNVLVFIYFLLKTKSHNQVNLWAFSFNCFSCLLFFILKIDWLESQFYLTHTSVNALLWLSGHIMAGFGHLALQINFLKK